MRQILLKTGNSKTLFYAWGIVLMSFLVCTPGQAQLINSFDIHYQVQQKGSIVFISNSAVTCSGTLSSSGTGAVACGVAQAQAAPTGTATDNNYVGAYVNIDLSTAGIFMSSSDSLKLPDCSEISWAGLYWGASVTTSGTPAVPTAAFSKRDSVKLKVNSGGYLSLKADTLWDNTIGFKTYHCFKNITSIVKTNGIKARYTIANMLAQTGVAAGNDFGGWTIVVVYRNDLQDMKNLTVFSGLANVQSGAPNNVVDVPISGFLTPPSGPVNFELGLVVYDGDRNPAATSKDSLYFKSGTGGFVPISNTVNPVNDIFNSTISNNGTMTPYRIPNYENTLGYDADIFKPDNSLKAYLKNSTTSATIRQTTGSETYLTQVITSAIDVYEPDMKVINQVTDINGGVLSPGDTIEYTLTLKNLGSDTSLYTVFEDTLGFNINFVPNSIRVVVGPNSSTIPKTDIADTDQGAYDATSRSIKVNIGTGATGTVGGKMGNSPTGTDSTIVKFRAVVTSECTKLVCDNTVSNRAFLKGTGKISGNFLVGASNPDLFDASGCPIKGSSVTALNAGICPPIVATSNSPICATDTIKLFAPTSTNATYAWSGPASFTSTLQNPIILNSAAANDGVYTVTITYVGSPSCSSVYTTTVVVKPLPTPSVVKSNDLTCGTPTATLTASPASGVTYSWGGGGTASTKIVNAAGTYTVTVTNTTTGCSASASVIVTSTVTVPLGGTTGYTGGVLCTVTNSGSISLSGHTGSIVKWQTSTDGGTVWSDIVSTANPYSFSNAVNNQQYRAVLNNGCSNAFSSAVTITVNAPSVGGTTSYSGISPLCNKINNGTITLSGYTGAIVKWQTSITGGTTWTDILNTTTTHNFYNALNNQQYRAIVNNGTSCLDANSVATTISATAAACIEICNDGIDNDGDGLIDCEDPDCGMKASPLIKK